MPEPIASDSPAEPEQTRAGARLLIVDDNKSIHQDFRKILGGGEAEDAELDAEAAALFDLEVRPASHAVYRIDSAYQGQDALALVEAALRAGDPFRVAFVDVRMPPGWDGIETVQRLWEVDPELQVVICTAYSDYTWDEMIGKLGETESLVILKKPFDNIEVLQLAHTLSRKWELSRRLSEHMKGLDRLVRSRTEDLEMSNERLRLEMADRERISNELSLSEERFSKAFSASPFPMAIQSLQSGKYLDVNPAFAELTGRSWGELVGHTPAELSLWLDASDHLQFLNLVRTTRSVQNFEWPMHSLVGGPRECLLFGETFALNAEPVVLITVLDVSEQRQMEYQLRHAQKMEAVGQLAAGVAHDFNNILTVIQGHASMLLAPETMSAEQVNSVKQVAHAAERATALTRQLLTFSRKQPVQRKPLRLNEVTRHLTGMLQRVIGEHIELISTLDTRDPVVRADEVNLEQIIMNVVVNARDAMPDGGVLRLGTELVEVDAEHLQRHPTAQLGTFVRMAFQDTGCGMSAETMARLFEPFFTTKDAGQGTGLGLATVYGIVAQHDGWIEVQSAVGQGTNFQVYLPLTDEPVAASSGTEDTELRGGSETILLVEDEPNVREIVQGILQHHGYRVLTASNGPEALGVWKESQAEIELLITDIMMPNGMRGTVLAEHLLKEKPELRVIYSSGYSAELATGSGQMPAGIVFLQKPFKVEVLIQAVREALDRAPVGA